MNKTQMGLIACDLIIVLLTASTVWCLIRVNDLQTQVSMLQTEKTSLQAQIDDLESQTANLQSQINNLTNTLGNLTADTRQYRSLDLGLFNINSGLFL